MKVALLRSLTLLAVLLVGPLAPAQISAPAAEPNRPLPDIPTLMHEVENHQRAAESIQKDYLFHEVVHQQRSDGKKSEVHEYDVFWLSGVQVHKLTRKDGRDLTADEQSKESERIDKEVKKANERKSKSDSHGKQTDSHGNEEVTVSRFLELGKFTNPRRVKLNGRDTIAIDYAGDPKAKTRNRTEDLIRDLSGTLWVDEQDHEITQIEGHFENAFKIGAGLFMSIKKGTSFSMQQMKINNEVWLPSRIEAQGGARLMLFISFDGSILITESDYRKFKATSTILPGVSTVKDAKPADSDVPSAPAPPSPPQ